jgi:hypothetical protein
MLAKQNLTQNFSKKSKFLRLKILGLRVSYKKKIRIFFCILKVTEERSWIRVRIHYLERYGSVDPDPHQNVRDP